MRADRQLIGTERNARASALTVSFQPLIEGQEIAAVAIAGLEGKYDTRFTEGVGALRAYQRLSLSYAIVDAVLSLHAGSSLDSRRMAAARRTNGVIDPRNR